jgi:hypothetical protein
MGWKELKDSLIIGLHEISLIYPKWMKQTIIMVAKRLPKALSDTSSNNDYKKHEQVTTEYLGYLLRIIRPSEKLPVDRIIEIMPIMLENYNELAQALLTEWEKVRYSIPPYLSYLYLPYASVSRCRLVSSGLG